MKRDWANLEALPLGLILDNLEEHIDHVWFGAVCKNWQLIVKLNHQNRQFKINTLPIPMLLVPPENSWALENTWCLYGIPNKRCYPFSKFHQFRLANRRLRVCGSSYGWLAFADNPICFGIRDDPDSTSIITLVNFFNDVPHITLPPINLVNKVTLNVDPIKSPNDYIVVAIFNGVDHWGKGNIAFTRKDQTFWTHLDTSNSGFIDVLFYNKDQVFAVSYYNKIVSFRFHADKKTITSNVVLEASPDEYCVRGHYLVKSVKKEELWMVRACSDVCEYYHVYKLQPDAKSKTLEQMVELKDLGDNVLFVGDGDSISVSASYFSKFLRKSSIYFAWNLDIYDMKEEKKYVTNYYSRDFEKFWVLSNFQCN